jgi:two-component system cell cycle sensor histidine kinase/response regulator CckA
VLALSTQIMKQVPDDGRAHDKLRLIHKSGERARDLVRQILTFARKTEPERGLVDAADFTASALKLLRSSIPTTINISSRLDPVPPIWADESQLYQILLNLVTNAAHAIGDRMGVISVEVTAVTDGPLGRGKAALRLSVIDSGSGMDDATRERIFEPFFTTKPVNEGTGLGLSVVHGIVAAHGGVITVDSKLGDGTRFDVYFLAADDKTGRREVA